MNSQRVMGMVSCQVGVAASNILAGCRARA